MHGRDAALLKKFLVERQDAKDAKIGKKREEDLLGVSSLGGLGGLGVLARSPRLSTEPRDAHATASARLPFRDPLPVHLPLLSG
jgi:hypothetical protein